MRIKIKMLLMTFVIAATVLAACTKQKIGGEETLNLSGSEVKAQSGFVVNLDRLADNIQNAYIKYYSGEGDGGLAHVTYWTISGAALSALPAQEQAKVAKIKGNAIHSALFNPTAIVAGYEVTGTINVEGRFQNITLRIPDNWNRKLIVAGTPGNRNEYANEAFFAPWLLAQGYAFISGDKNCPTWANLLSGQHISSQWGMMMLDMAQLAQANIESATTKAVKLTYAVGLSNGGYQVRRALEIDKELHPHEKGRLFNGGLDWSGTYFPGVADMDSNGDGQVSVEEFAAANHVVSTLEKAALAMKWTYDPATLSNPANYASSPRFAEARSAMQAAGFSNESDIFWSIYNNNFDFYKAYGGAYMMYKGIGYYNFTAYVYRAELMGDTMASSANYTSFFNANNPVEPPFYNYLRTAVNGNWTDAAVAWHLKNANTGDINVPLITLQGDKDGLLPLYAHGSAYANAVKRAGKDKLHRFYVIANGAHVDKDADGYGDFDWDGAWGEENAKNELTPMQAYVEKAFDLLQVWVEEGNKPVDSKTVYTDPANDIADKNLVVF